MDINTLKKKITSVENIISKKSVLKKHYDICVAGVWYGANYGSLLNGYAIYRILKDMGKDVLMLQKPGASNTDPEITSGHNTRFVKRYYNSNDISPLLSYADLKELNKFCDCFCAGSDQIWNYNLSFSENLYLPFVDNGKKLISFSTSFGHKKDFTPDSAKSRIKSYFRRFHAISVREQFDADILKMNYGVAAEVLFDPVFCLPQKYYDNLISHSKMQVNEPYLLTYILDPTPEKREAIKYYEDITGLKAINILDGAEGTHNKNKELLSLPNILENVGAEDFLKAYKNAGFIITDSFHGTAFSAIFNKNFIAIGNYKRGYERFEDLLGRLGLSSRLISNAREAIESPEKFLTPIDYSAVNQIISQKSKQTLEWISHVINTPIEELHSILLPGNAITSVLNATECMGCGACTCICPTNALTLKQDKWGYYRSSIDYERCINCGKCTHVCPAYKLPEKRNSKNPSCFEFIAASKDTVKKSSSGGAFSLLATEAFKNNGYVVGAAWTKEFSVKHIIVNQEDELAKLRKSKYLQSYLGDTFNKVKKLLDNNEFVLFSGCPCQVAGLKAFLGTEYTNLITIDLLCGNSPSSIFFKKYLLEAFPDKLEKYEFRNKDQGWNSDCIAVTIAGQKRVLRGPRDDDYQRVYHNHTMCPPHCEKCKYQSLPRFGDITIGDFWGVTGKDHSIDTSNGTSIVLCNNEKGRKFFDAIPSADILVKKEVPLSWIGGNGYAIGSHNYCSDKRDIFYEAIQRMPFSKAVDFALKPNHGIYEPIYKKSNALLQYSSLRLHFKYNPIIWEEHFIDGNPTLIVHDGMSKVGQYASLPLFRNLEKGKPYKFCISFKTKTESSIINFHIKDSGSNSYQIIKSYDLTGKNPSRFWQKINVDFIPDAGYYDEFMIGASQVKGSGNFIMFEYISITAY